MAANVSVVQQFPFDHQFLQFDVTAPHVAYTILGGFVVVFGMFSLFIREKLYIGEACWAFLFGVIFGPYGANIFNPRQWAPSESSIVDSEALNTITLELTRVVLAIGVFAIGVELPKQYVKKHWRSLFFLLLPIMTWGWFVSAGLIYVLIPGLSFLSSLAVAACLTPTDPILAAAVIGGKYADKHVPAHLRHLLAAESGCNDGAAFPFLYIALYLAIEASDAHAVQDWFLITILYEVVLGVVFGSLLGFGFRHLMRFCERKDLIDRKSYVAQYVSLALFSVGATTLLGSDDLLSAFASGTAFAWDGFFNKQTEDSAFSSVIDLLFNIAAFIYIGAWMPFNQFSSAILTLTPWRLIVLAVLILIVRRLPIVLALYRWIPDVKTFREAFFSGHFGPIGVGAIFISTLAVEQLPRAQDPPQNQVELLAASIQPIVGFMVLCSVAVHGLSIPFFSLGRRVHSVSRTWSRHQSTDLVLGPEWATQTRRVVRAEDVVINRDGADAIEAMELGQSDKVAPNTKSETKEESPVSDTPREVLTLGDESSVSDTHREVVTLGHENPPHGGGRTGENTEWREGPHLIIEYDHGPGSEVEVEVIRDAFDEGKQEKLSTAFHGTEASVRKDVGKYIQKLVHVPKMVEHEVAHELHKAKNEALHIRDETLEGLRHGEDVNSQKHDEDDPKEEHVEHHHEDEPNHEYEEDEQENEDEWHDEDTANVARGVSSTISAPASSHVKKRSRSPRHSLIRRPTFSQSRVSAGKRRESFRRSILGAQPKVQPPSPPASPTLDIADSSLVEETRRRRGRATGQKNLPRPGTSSSTGSGTHTPQDSISHLRFGSLRATSPSRSVRFADVQGKSRASSGSQTPAVRPGTPSPDTPIGSSSTMHTHG